MRWLLARLGFKRGGLARTGLRDDEVVAQLSPPVIVLDGMLVHEVPDCLPKGYVLAPFNPWVTQRLRDWQGTPWVHPLSCSGPEHQPHKSAAMMVLPIGLYCEYCATLQERVPACCLSIPMLPPGFYGTDVPMI
jgi:hypothetical protein